MEHCFALGGKRNELEFINSLFTQGADSTIENGDGKTPLNLTEERNHVEIIDALKKCISQVAWFPSDTDSLAPHNSQPVAANLNKVSYSTITHMCLHLANKQRQLFCCLSQEN